MASDELRRKEPSDSFLVDENLTSVVHGGAVQDQCLVARVSSDL
jgi:hypothetical protein